MPNTGLVLPFNRFPDTSSAVKTVVNKPLSVGFICAFLEGARRQGQDINAILHKAGLARALLDDPQATFDGIELQRLMIAVTEQLDDLYMGFVKDRYKPVLNYAVMTMALSSETLGESIRTRISAREAIRDDVHYAFQINKKAHEFSLALSGFKLVKGVDPQAFYWLRLSSIYRYHSWLIGRRIKLNRVDISGPEPKPKSATAGTAAHWAMFNCEVRFNQPQCAIYYDNKYLGYPIIRTDRETLQGVAIEHYDDWLDVPGSDLSLSRQVEQALESLQQDGIFHVSTQDLAQKLRITPRSLRNQLSREKVSFQQLKTRARQDAAINKLLSSALPVSAVAEELGYSEPGDFSRNFKRWTGLSPSEYRAKHTKR